MSKYKNADEIMGKLILPIAVDAQAWRKNQSRKAITAVVEQVEDKAMLIEVLLDICNESAFRQKLEGAELIPKHTKEERKKAKLAELHKQYVKQG